MDLRNLTMLALGLLACGADSRTAPEAAGPELHVESAEDSVPADPEATSPAGPDAAMDPIEPLTEAAQPEPPTAPVDPTTASEPAPTSEPSLAPARPSEPERLEPGTTSYRIQGTGAPGGQADGAAAAGPGQEPAPERGAARGEPSAGAAQFPSNVDGTAPTAVERTATPAAGIGAARLELGVAGGPRGLTIADFDGDGRGELYVATDSPGALHVWRGLTPGLAPVPIPTSLPLSDFPLGPVVAGERLAFGLRSSNELAYFTPNGRESAADREAVELLALGGKPRALATGVSTWTTGGGARTLVVTDTPELLVLQPDGQLEARAPLADLLPTAVATVPGGVVVASQGRPSLIFYSARWRNQPLPERTDDDAQPSEADESEARALGDQWLRFEPAAELTLDGIPRSLAVLDLDRDGDPELVCLFGDRSVLALGLGVTEGFAPWLSASATAPAPVRWPAGAMPVHLTTADLDGDGHRELFATHLNELLVSCLGDFTVAGPRAVNPVYAGAGPWQSALGDLDGDGRIDLAVTNPEAGAVSVFFSSDEATSAWASSPDDPLGGFANAPNRASVAAPHTMAAGDFDADGRDDLCLFSALEDRAAIHLGAGAEGIGPAQFVALPPEADEVVAGQLDLDAGAELLCTFQSALGSELFALGGDPTGTGWRGAAGRDDAGAAAVVATQAAGLVLADLDGDGIEEAIVSDRAGHALVVVDVGLDDQGVPHPRVRQRLALDQAPGALAVIRQPIASGSAARGAVRGLAVGLVDGDEATLGLFSLAGAAAAPLRLVGSLPLVRPAQDIVGADLDGDGHSDLAILMQGATDNQAGQIALYLAPSGERQSWQQVTSLVCGPKAFQLAAQDLDGDGAAELFASSQYAYRVDSWVGVPAGRGEPGRDPRPRPSWRLGAHRGCMDLAFVDVDGDGQLELAVANNHSSDVSLLRFHAPE